MQAKTIYIISGIIGLAAGLGTTYPYNLRFLPAIILWGVTGLIVGVLTKDNREATRAGIIYGVLLAISFLLSRFGGSPNKLPAYFLLILVLSIGAAIGGVIAALVGSKLKRLLK